MIIARFNGEVPRVVRINDAGVLIGSDYSHQWLTCWEIVQLDSGLISVDDLEQRYQTWRSSRRDR